MKSCIISLASNSNQEENLSEARSRLGQILSDCSYTRSLWTKPYKASADSSFASEQKPADNESLYINQLLYARTTLGVEVLQEALKDIEQTMGRNEENRRKGIVPIDLDLMAYDKERYHLNDWQRPYIQLLLEK